MAIALRSGLRMALATDIARGSLAARRVESLLQHVLQARV